MDDEADMARLDRGKVNKAWEDPEAEGTVAGSLATASHPFPIVFSPV